MGTCLSALVLGLRFCSASPVLGMEQNTEDAPGQKRPLPRLRLRPPRHARPLPRVRGGARSAGGALTATAHLAGLVAGVVVGFGGGSVKRLSCFWKYSV